MENEQKESAWWIPVNIVRQYSILFVLVGIFAFVCYGLPYIAQNTQFGKDLASSIQSDEDLKNQQYDNVRNSNDCVVLKQTILQLISDGANDKSWFPNGSDTNLRIGKDRFDYLGCKN